MKKTVVYHEVTITFSIRKAEADRITTGASRSQRMPKLKSLFRAGLEGNEAMAPDLEDLQIKVDGK